MNVDGHRARKAESLDLLEQGHQQRGAIVVERHAIERVAVIPVRGPFEHRQEAIKCYARHRCYWQKACVAEGSQVIRQLTRAFIRVIERGARGEVERRERDAHHHERRTHDRQKPPLLR
jgi:hypothetical protein